MYHYSYIKYNFTLFRQNFSTHGTNHHSEKRETILRCPSLSKTATRATATAEKHRKKTMALITTTTTTTITDSESSSMPIESTNIALGDKNSLYSNLSDFENDATPDGAETSSDDDSEFMAEEYHPHYYSCAHSCKDIAMEERTNRRKKTVRFLLPPVDEEQQQQQLTLRKTKTKRHVFRKRPKDCGFLDWGYLNTMWILDILLCV
jgi:hypothetical protein